MPAKRKAKQDTDLTVVEKEPITEQPRLNPQALLKVAIEKGTDIATLERLVQLAKDVRAEQAKAAYNEAMAEFHKRCPAIFKTSKAVISTRGGGSFSYKFASLDELNKRVLPVMASVGLTVSYRIAQKPESVTSVCRITHALGHFEESGPIEMPIVIMSGEDGKTVGANPAQCVGIAMSYARRYSFLAITGLAAQDEDKDGQPSIEEPRRQSEATQPTKPQAPSKTIQTISDDEWNQIFIEGKQAGIGPAEKVMAFLTGQFGIRSRNEITGAQYPKVLESIRGWKPAQKAEKKRTPSDASEGQMKRVSPEQIGSLHSLARRHGWEGKQPREDDPYHTYLRRVGYESTKDLPADMVGAIKSVLLKGPESEGFKKVAENA
jgi:hypothetical protein